MLERDLEVVIRVTDLEFYVSVYDSESGDDVEYGPYEFSKEDENRFNNDIGNEFYGWAEIVKENLNATKEGDE